MTGAVSATVRVRVPAQPSGAAFDVVLLLHVAAVVVGLLTVVVSGVSAARLLASGDGEVPAGVRSYFSPGVNWAGRVLYAVPVLGFALLGLSHGAFDLADSWVVTGLCLWLVAIGVAEGWLWPSERRVQAVLGATAAAGAVAPAAEAAGVGSPEGPSSVATGTGRATPAANELHDACWTACASSVAVVAIIVSAMVVMFVRP